MAVVGTNNWNAIAYGNGKYVAVGASGYVTTSTDGKTWTTPTKIAEFSYTWNDIAYGNGKFVVVGGSGRYHHPPMVQVGQRRSIIIHMEAGCQLHMVMVNLLWQAIVVVTI